MASLGRDIASEILLEHAGAYTAATAGGSGDATEIVGTTIDLTALASRPQSVVFLIPCAATLAATKTLTLVGDIEVSDDGGSTWTTQVTSSTLLTLTGQSGGSTEKDVAKIGVNLALTDINAVRVNVTPDMSATGTDTAKIGGIVAVFGGLDQLPQ